jgi:hypothetical protein
MSLKATFKQPPAWPANPVMIRIPALKMTRSGRLHRDTAEPAQIDAGDWEELSPRNTRRTAPPAYKEGQSAKS